MRSKIIYVILIVLLSSCTSPREKAISKMDDYNNELKKFPLDSIQKIDTAAINAQFYKIDIPSIGTQAMSEISSENSFKELLKTEKDILTKWENIKDFKSYFGIRPDTLKGIIRRCSAFDRAPISAERVPSARGMRAVSLDYYKVEVPVAFHIIKNQRGNGQLPNMTAQINDQIKALNRVYNKFNINFIFFSIDITTNDVWFNKASYYNDTNALKQMTRTLTKNPEKVMNVYTLGSQQVLGEATYPWYVDKGTSMDYIVINYNTLPGGQNTFYNGMYNEGKTLIHEVGHFLGLFHTFEGGNVSCNSSLNGGCNIGDQVDDTPSQEICYFNGCDENADSCPYQPGKDAVKNFMGYNPDECMEEMTNGQGDRLLQSIIKYRYYFIINPAL